MSRDDDGAPLLDHKDASRHHGIDQSESQFLHGDRRSDNNGIPQVSFDIESSLTTSTSIRERQQQQQQLQTLRTVPRPSRRLHVATPTPLEPITDPFAFVCEFARRPKFGHQYVLCPQRNQKRGDRVGLSVGPHWAGVIYTMSMIGIITLFLAKVLVGPHVAPWCQPAIVACSAVTMAFLLATAVADPGIVVESAESGDAGSCGYCEECSIWTPQGAEHCEECGVCIFGLDHHCPWMGKCVGRGNMLWFRLFNGSWILFLSILLVIMPWINSHKDPSRAP